MGQGNKQQDPKFAPVLPAASSVPTPTAYPSVAKVTDEEEGAREGPNETDRVEAGLATS
jgi:hypothetical protein